MNNFKNNLELRRILKEITEKYIGKEVNKQIKLIAELSNEYPHSIRIKEEAIPGKPSTFGYNCYQYALDIISSPEYEEIARRHKDIYANSEFIIYLIENNVLKEIKWEDRKNGDIIIYFDSKGPTHAGRIYSGRIISKWGLAHLWEHDIYEVPIDYGSEFKIFSRIDKNLCVISFIEYTKSKGVR